MNLNITDKDIEKMTSKEIFKIMSDTLLHTAPSEQGYTILLNLLYCYERKLKGEISSLFDTRL